jgi:hypothetical protein
MQSSKQIFSCSSATTTKLQTSNPKQVLRASKCFHSKNASSQYFTNDSASNPYSNIKNAIETVKIDLKSSIINLKAGVSEKNGPRSSTGSSIGPISQRQQSKPKLMSASIREYNEGILPTEE